MDIKNNPTEWCIRIAGAESCRLGELVVTDEDILRKPEIQEDKNNIIISTVRFYLPAVVLRKTLCIRQMQFSHTNTWGRLYVFLMSSLFMHQNLSPLDLQRQTTNRYLIFNLIWSLKILKSCCELKSILYYHEFQILKGNPIFFFKIQYILMWHTEMDQQNPELKSLNSMPAKISASSKVLAI